VLLAAVRARHFARDKPVVNMPPVSRTGVGCVDADLLDGIAWSTRSTLAQPETRKRISPPGRT
jgi:hypothetical protein